MVFKHMKKGQAAMEFLMTYSWAILAVLVVIGALVYFGVFDFENFFPDRCALGHPIQCKDHTLSEEIGNTTLSILISNQDQRSLSITNVTVTSEALDDTCYADTSTGTTNSVATGWLNSSVIKKGAQHTITIKEALGGVTCKPSETISRNKNKYEITVEYNFKANPDFKHQIKGEILATTSKRGAIVRDVVIGSKPDYFSFFI